MPRFLFCFAAALLLAGPAHAQQLKLDITGGLVTLDATGATARQILAEWARVGGTQIVGADKVTGAPITLKLADVPEREALDLILRNVAGFMAATRLPSSEPGASSYHRILILPTTTAPAVTNARNNTTAPAANNALNGTQRGRVPPRPPNLQPPPGTLDPDAEEPPVQPDQADTGVQQPVFTFPSPAPGGATFAPQEGQPSVAPGTPVITLAPNANGQPTIYNFVPNSGAAVPPPAPSNVPTFGVGSPTPGMIQAPPPPTPAGTRPPPRQ